LKAIKAGERQLWVKSCLGLADVGVSSHELLLGGAEIRPAFEQRRRQTRGDFGAQVLQRQRIGSGDGPRIAPEQDAQKVLLLFDPTKCVGDCGFGGEHQDPGLVYVLYGAHASLFARASDFQGVSADFEGALRDLELEIQFQKVQIGGGDVRD
jgi:hypothetical protein